LIPNPVPAIRSTLGPHGEHWIKNRARDGDAFCLLGASCEALFVIFQIENGLADEFCDLLDQTATEQFPKRVTRSNGVPQKRPLVYFNDHQRTNFDDVTLVLDKVEVSWTEVHPPS
jgi:hypothetical protein